MLCAVTSHCVTDCRPVDGGPGGQDSRHVVEFHQVALPSGIAANEDLLRLIVYDQDHHVVPRSTFRLDPDSQDTTSAPFDIRTEHGRGVVYTVRALPDRQSYRLSVEGVAYDASGHTVLYHTTFVIYISVSSYPY